ncbi:MAG: hypothetical protein U7M05_10995, partial [Candidatus Igneacidithiobacillus chanchocoensis]
RVEAERRELERQRIERERERVEAERRERERQRIERERERIEAERRERERRRPALEIADEWARLVAAARRQVEAQAARAVAALRRHLDTNWRQRNENHAPVPPTGLFAVFQRPAYEVDLAKYERRRQRLEARQAALLRRMRFVEQCRREAGERLAEARAARAHPQLAAEIRARASEIERARKIQQQQQRDRQQQERAKTRKIERDNSQGIGL